MKNKSNWKQKKTQNSKYIPKRKARQGKEEESWNE